MYLHRAYFFSLFQFATSGCCIGPKLKVLRADFGGDCLVGEEVVEVVLLVLFGDSFPRRTGPPASFILFGFP